MSRRGGEGLSDILSFIFDVGVCLGKRSNRTTPTYTQTHSHIGYLCSQRKRLGSKDPPLVKGEVDRANMV